MIASQASKVALSFAQFTEHVKSPRHPGQPLQATILAVTTVPHASLRPSKSHTHVAPTAVIPQSKSVLTTVVRPVSAALPNLPMTRPRHAYRVVTKSNLPILRHLPRSSSSKHINSPTSITAAKALMVSAAQGNMSYFSDFEDLNGGYVAFGGNLNGGKITSKGKIKIGKLDFDDVYFVKELKFNLFGVSKMCDKKNSVLFTDNECLVLSPDFKLPDESHVLLRVPRENNMYNFCGIKGIKREFSVLRTPQQNGIAERKNMTLIEAARTMLADSLLPIPFWAEAVNTACYETLHVNFLENKPNIAGFQDPIDAKKVGEEVTQTYVLFLAWSAGSTNPQNNDKNALVDGKDHGVDIQMSVSADIQFEGCTNNSSNGVNAASSTVPTVRHNLSNSTNIFSAAGPSNTTVSPTYGKSSSLDASTSFHDPDMPALEELTYFDDEANVGAEADVNNLESSIPFSLIPTTIIHKDHPISQIISDLSSTTQTRSMARAVKDQGGLSKMFDKDFHTCMFACFLSQKEPKRKVWILVDLPYEKRAIGTKWVYRNKKDERGIVIRNKARLIAQGHTREERIDYKEVFAPVARIEAIRLFLAYASFMGFLVYQMDVKSVFLYGTIEEEVYVCQPLGFKDPDHPDKVYKVVKALYGLHQAPRAWYETLATYLLENGFQIDDIIFGATNKDLCKSFEKLMKDRFQMSSMGELTFFLGLQVKQKKDGIFICQDKYIAKLLRKFRLTKGKSASTPIDIEKPLLKDLDAEDVDVHTYRFMIGSLMYLTSSRPDIMFAVCACARFQVTPKASHLHAVKRIFRYLKVKPQLGLWYPKDSPFDLVAYSDSDYVGASLDRKSEGYVIYTNTQDMG
nr:hypothetical protein [Tanacetum cinerariifolium]